MIANIDLIAHLLEVWSLSVCFPQIYCFWEVLSCTFLLVTPRMVNLHRRCQWLFTPSKRFYLFRFFSQFPLGPFQVFVGLLKINSGFQLIPSGPYSSIFYFAGMSKILFYAGYLFFLPGFMGSLRTISGFRRSPQDQFRFSANSLRTIFLDLLFCRTCELKLVHR